jgi:hypothetical protein
VTIVSGVPPSEAPSESAVNIQTSARPMPGGQFTDPADRPRAVLDRGGVVMKARLRPDPAKRCRAAHRRPATCAHTPGVPALVSTMLMLSERWLTTQCLPTWACRNRYGLQADGHRRGMAETSRQDIEDLETIVGRVDGEQARAVAERAPAAAPARIRKRRTSQRRSTADPGGKQHNRKG